MIRPNIKYCLLKPTFGFGVGYEFETDADSEWRNEEYLLANYLTLEAFIEDLRVEEVGVWKPKEREEYLLVDSSYKDMVYKGCWFNSDIDIFRASIGNVFKTKEAAQNAAEKIKALLLECPKE